MVTMPRERQWGTQNLGKCTMNFSLSTLIFLFLPSVSSTETQQMSFIYLAGLFFHPFLHWRLPEVFPKLCSVSAWSILPCFSPANFPSSFRSLTRHHPLWEDFPPRSGLVVLLSFLHNVTTHLIIFLEVNLFLKTEVSLSAGRVKFDLYILTAKSCTWMTGGVQFSLYERWWYEWVPASCEKGFPWNTLWWPWFSHLAWASACCLLHNSPGNSIRYGFLAGCVQCPLATRWPGQVMP